MNNFTQFSFLLLMVLAMALFGCQETVNVDPTNAIASKSGNNPALTTATNPAPCVIGPNDHHLCETKDLIAGQNYKVGTVKVYCEDGTTNYKVVYKITAPGCYISETHLYAGPESGIPKNGPGCPKIGHFPYKMEGLQATTVCHDVGSISGAFTVAAHAVVSCSGSGAPFNGEETAWGQGKGFPNCNNWSMCFNVDCKK